MKFFQKIILLAGLLSCFLPGAIVLAADTGAMSPSINPICWTKDDCVRVRQNIYGVKDHPENGFVEQPPCNSVPGWGMCLPAGMTKAEISFGGNANFSDIGSYVLVVYNYALRIAAVLAVIIIIIAGVQYVTSGGNSEMITSAKKRITGALIGLFIAYMSYFILNTINPALVNLRLPQSFLLKPSPLSYHFCSNMATTTVFAAVPEKIKDKIITKNPKDFSDAFGSLVPADFKYNLDPQKNGYKDMYKRNFACNPKSTFFIGNGNGQVCYGDYCPLDNSGFPQVCVADQDDNKCVKGELVITYYLKASNELLSHSLLPCEGNLEVPDWLDSNAVVWGVCQSSDKAKLAIGSTSGETWGNDYWEVMNYEPNESKSPYEYTIVYGGFSNAHDESYWGCPSNYKLVGFILKNEVNVNCNLFKDANLNIGYKEGNPGSGIIFGSWGKTVKIENYIPLDKLSNGLRMKLDLDDETIQDIVQGDKGTSPTAGEGQ